jgi:hypothetical protein
MATTAAELNAHATREFGAREARVGGVFEDGDAPHDPAWVGDLRAEPLTSIKVGSETIGVVAEQATARSANGCSRWEPSASRSLPSTRATPIALSQ